MNNSLKEIDINYMFSKESLEVILSTCTAPSKMVFIKGGDTNKSLREI
jgi:hypothetical protein